MNLTAKGPLLMVCDTETESLVELDNVRFGAILSCIILINVQPLHIVKFFFSFLTIVNS